MGGLEMVSYTFSRMLPTRMCEKTCYGAGATEAA
jgi:hypothetical protein